MPMSGGGRKPSSEFKMAKKSEADNVAERLTQFVENDTSVIGLGVAKASEISGFSKLAVYVGGVAALILAVGTSPKAQGAALTLVATTPYPVVRSLRVMEVGPGPEQGVLLLYWSLFALVLSIPVPLARLLILLALQHPVTDGAALLYHRALRPFLLLQHGDLNLSAFKALHPLLASTLGLTPAALASAQPAAVTAAVKDASSHLGCAPPVVRTDSPPPPPAPQEVNILANPAEFHLLQSAALSGIRNAAKA